MITATAKEIVALETKGMFWTMSVKGDVCVFLVMFLYLIFQTSITCLQFLF